MGGTKSDVDMTKLWPLYKKKATEELRNVIMEHYLALVKYNAERIHAKLPDEVDIEDLFTGSELNIRDM